MLGRPTDQPHQDCLRQFFGRLLHVQMSSARDCFFWQLWDVAPGLPGEPFPEIPLDVPSTRRLFDVLRTRGRTTNYTGGFSLMPPTLYPLSVLRASLLEFWGFRLGGRERGYRTRDKRSQRE